MSARPFSSIVRRYYFLLALSAERLSSTFCGHVQGLLVLGAIFKRTQPDESDLERRELERMVAEAASGKSKHQKMKIQAKANLHQKKNDSSGSPQILTPPEEPKVA